MPKFIVFDIDGTLSDDSWRLHYINPEKDDDAKQDWDKYHLDSKHDLPIENAVELYQRFTFDYMVVLVTARPEKWRDHTVKWLRDNGIHFHSLLMRPDTDYNSSAKVKLRLIQENGLTPKNTLLIIDNDERVVDALREEGYFVLCAATKGK